ncbi:hypothetical protein OF83DRAFT_625564 [Amylostereum chailletii]|nr:hypothetical protein OF83DRAFT_625564 [Amylostereum chailletii]
MLSLPVELQLRIFELATHVPRLFEITPDINGIFLNDSRGVATILDILEDFHRSLLTRKSLALVSRTFNAVATPILYSCIHLTASSAEVMSSIDASKGHMVRHVIMDFPQRVGASTEVKVASFFDLLPNVQALTIRMAKFIPGGTPFLYPNGILARTMVKQLGPTLRKLTLEDPSPKLLRPSDFDAFTSSLVHLECFTCFCSFPSVSYSENLVKFPPSLPHLTHVNIQNIPLAFPPNATPTHVLCPLNNHIPSLLSPALTHLSLTISNTAISFDVYSALRLHAPNLTSLAISGPLPDVTRFLASGPVPAIPRLTFVHIHPKIREVPTSTEPKRRCGLTRSQRFRDEAR